MPTFQQNTGNRDFSISDIFNKSFEIFKADPGSYIGFTICGGIVTFAVGLVPVIGSIVNFVIGLPFQMGHAAYANKYPRGNGQFNSFFDGFKAFGNLLVYSLLIIAIGSAIILPTVFGLMAVFGFSRDNLPAISAPLIMLFIFFLIVLIVLGLFLFFAPYYIFFNNMKPIDAIKASFRLSKPNLSKLFLFNVAMALIAVAGALCLLVGLLVAIPIVRIANFYLFKHLTHLDEDDIFDFDKKVVGIDNAL
jgi:hypothetical protein